MLMRDSDPLARCDTAAHMGDAMRDMPLTADTVSPPEPRAYRGVNWDGLEYFNAGINKGSVFLFKPSTKAMDGDSRLIKLKGLNRNKRYTLKFQDRTALNCTMSGKELMDKGISVTAMTGNNASEIIWIN